MDEPKERPLAAFISAIPGWRAVMLYLGDVVPKEEGDALEYRQIRLEVAKITSWAMTLPCLEPSPDCMHIKPQSTDIFDGIFGFGRSSSTETTNFVPMSNDRQLSVKEIHRLVPPCDLSDEQLITDAKKHIETMNERYKGRLKPKPKL